MPWHAQSVEVPTAMPDSNKYRPCGFPVSLPGLCKPAAGREPVDRISPPLSLQGADGDRAARASEHRLKPRRFSAVLQAFVRESKTYIEVLEK
ncbi:hypothetical protein [Labrys neptuniae]